jgi:hypothetical protein
MQSYPGRLILGVLLGLTGGLQAAQPSQPVTVVAVQVQGTVEVQHGASTVAEKVIDGTQLGKDDIISTAAQSSVMLVIPNGSVVALKEKSRLKISVALQSPLAGEGLAATAVEAPETGVSKTSFELTFGEMLTRVRKLNPSSTFEVQTPVSVAAVRGTVFEVSYQAGAAGEAQYQLSTASGLVHVTPHAGKMVVVPADDQVELLAELGSRGVKIKHVKSGKLDRRKKERIQQEGLDNERKAGEHMKRLRPPGAGPNATDRTQDTTPGNTPRAEASQAATNQAKTAAGQTGTRENTTGQTNPVAPAARTTVAPSNPAAPAAKPVPPPAKPKTPTRAPTVKRPPRPPGT